MYLKIIFLFVVSALAAQDNCPSGPYIITVRETNAPPNGGLVRELANETHDALPGSDIYDVKYPATAVNPIYFTSEPEGVKSTVQAIQNFTSQCPEADIILLGYSQGAQVVADVLCGTSEALFPKTDPLPSELGQRVKAAVLMGDASHVPNTPYGVGNSTKKGWFPRQTNTRCEPYTDILRSYCDANDTYCDSGNSMDVHSGYVQEYGKDAVHFIVSKLQR